MRSRVLVALPLAGLLLAALAPAMSGAGFPLRDGSAEQEAASAWLRSGLRADGCAGTAQACGHATTSWALIALAATGHVPRLVAAEGGASPMAYLAAHAAQAGSLATDWERAIVAIGASGADPAGFGGVDHWAELDAHWDGVQLGSPNALNDDIWGIYAYGFSDRPSHRDRVASLARYLAAHQKADGGWPNWLATHTSDSWGTASAILALVAAGEDPSSLRIQRAVSHLADLQLPSGLFPEEGAASVEATAWAILALDAVGEDPSGPDWAPPGGADPVSALRALQRADGAFPHAPGGSASLMATQQAMIGLWGAPFPFRPPQAAFGWEPAVPRTGEPVTLRDRSVPGSAPLASWRWSGAANGTGAPLAVTFPAPGEVAVRLWVRDADGRASVADEHLTVANRPPVARLAVTPKEPESGALFVLDASASHDPDGHVVSWSFSVDGRTIAPADGNATRSFSLGGAGPHEAAVTVTDDRGANASATVRFEVRQDTTATTGAPAPAGTPRPLEAQRTAAAQDPSTAAEPSSPEPQERATSAPLAAGPALLWPALARRRRLRRRLNTSSEVE